MEIISTKEAPAAIGPYSQGIITTGKIAFLSGQIAIDPSTGQMVGGGIEAETKQVMKNIGALLTAAGVNYGRIAKSTIFLKNFNDFAKVNEIYGSFFEHPLPARSTVEVARLPKDALIEIECIVSL